MVLGALVAFMNAIGIALSSTVENYYDMLHILWPAAPGGGVVGTLMLVLGEALYRSGHDDKK